MVRSKQVRARSIIFVTFCLLLMLVIGSCTGVTSPTPAPASTSPISTLPSLSDIVSKVMPSVVYILVDTTDTDIFGEPIQAAGSGVILRSDGYILTNRHVVEDAKKVEVNLHDLRVYDVVTSNIWRDDVVDLAVVKIEEQNLPTVPFGDPEKLSVGDWVIAIGHALGLSPLEGGPTVTQGIISNLDRSFTIETTAYYDVIQTDAAINPGNSGGPLINLAGEVIGIDSAGAAEAQNIGFAINVATARHVFEDLVKYGKPHHPFLGATLVDVTPNNTKNSEAPKIGALVANIELGSPAGLAGLQKDDVIARFGSSDVVSAASLIRELWRHEVGDTVEVVYWRDRTQVMVSVTLGQRAQTSAV